MKRIKLLTISLLTIAVAFSGCGKDEDSRFEVELIQAKSEIPSQIRLFFKVDLGEDHLFTTLEPQDFEIYENGSLISRLESQAQIQREEGEFMFSSILLLDLSGSVLRDTELPNVKSAATSFINSVMPAITDETYGSKEMAIYWFDGEEEIHLLVPFTTEIAQLNEGISSIDEDISNDVSTNLNGAVVQGLSLMNSRLVETRLNPNISTAGSVVIFTDGTDQASRVTTREAQDAVNEAGSDNAVFTIGLGDEIDESVLKTIGRDGFELAENSFDLNATFLKVAQKVQSESQSFYVLEYCSPKRSGDHTLELRALYENRFGSFRTTFSADGFTGGCTIE
ncbi:MAG: VWA domain-containing protein [Balneola sp.]|nr:MAG: VWA domain-containing protein [Balneola sp.]